MNDVYRNLIANHDVRPHSSANCTTILEIFHYAECIGVVTCIAEKRCAKAPFP